MQAKRKDVSTWLCAAWCAQEQTLTGQSPSSLKCTIGLKTPHTCLTQGGHRRGGVQSSSLVPAPRGVLMVLLTLAGETGASVGRGLRSEACSYFAHCAVNSGCEGQGFHACPLCGAAKHAFLPLLSEPALPRNHTELGAGIHCTNSDWAAH